MNGLISPDTGDVRFGGEALTGKLQDIFKADQTAWDHFEAVDLLPSRIVTRKIEIKEGEGTRTVTIQARAPQQVRITLARVDQMIFEKLSGILGRDYLQRFDPLAYIDGDPALPEDQLARLAAQMLPATTHNPIIEFFLRRGVRFHDGHELTAEDVKFTYESIVDPANLSPRVPLFEPVKQVEVIDPYTLRIVYKRLYSVALVRWSMGILPAHLLNAAALT